MWKCHKVKVLDFISFFIKIWYNYGHASRKEEHYVNIRPSKAHRSLHGWEAWVSEKGTSWSGFDKIGRF